DSESLRARVAEKVGADGTDAYSLLSRIGRDCVGALQFFPEDDDVDFSDLYAINHYKMTEIHGRHFIQTAKRAGLPDYIAKEALEEISGAAEHAMQEVEKSLPEGFPEALHLSVIRGMKSRLNSLG